MYENIFFPIKLASTLNCLFAVLPLSGDGNCPE